MTQALQSRESKQVDPASLPPPPPAPPSPTPPYSPPVGVVQTKRVGTPMLVLLSTISAILLGASVYGIALLIPLGKEGTNGASSTSTATQGTPGGGAEEEALFGPYSRPSGMPACPDPTVLLAWAELDNGWVSVCGHSEEQPTLMVAAVPEIPQGDEGAATPAAGLGTYEISTETVRFDESTGGYVGDLASGSTMWVSSAPGTLGLQDATGMTVGQYQLVVYLFVGMPAPVALGEDNAAGSGSTGAYGVEVPDATADDQVRYLAEIIARSEEARASLAPSVEAIRGCSTTSGLGSHIDVIASTRDNRAELMAALSTAPVDRIEGGTVLVDQLTAALQASYDADVAYLEWAEGIQARGCGSAPSTRGDEFSGEAQRLKEIFSGNWNANISPRFGVARVSSATL